MIGSSNFTCAGMGIGGHRNAEANLLTLVERVAFGRDVGQLAAVWPDVVVIADPDAAEWLGAQPERDEEEQAAASPVPRGFLGATYRAGDVRQVLLYLAPDRLPEAWDVYACGRQQDHLIGHVSWEEFGRPETVELSWSPVQPPERLLVRWGGNEAFLPLNVEDSHKLPAPESLSEMSADDMLWILAASDPSAAFRVWARQSKPSDIFDDDLDSATPPDLDPLRRYDLEATFLHRIRRRARILARLRANLERPVWSRQAVEWHLRGLIGIEPLAERMAGNLAAADGAADEALLSLADFLIVLREVDYQPRDGALSKPDFEAIFRPFLGELANRLDSDVTCIRDRLGAGALQFWDRVLERCRN
ncbi:hypothetical protein HS125_05570 [bacterium]|nr:hypothetical protein [bacterium]